MKRKIVKEREKVYVYVLAFWILCIITTTMFIAWFG